MTLPFLHAVRKPIDGFYNLRDLGGLPGAQNKITKYGQFLRSDVPRPMSSDALAYLSAFPVRLSVDLRTSGERKKHPSALSGQKGIKELHIPMIEDDQMDLFFTQFDPSSKTILGDFYIYLLDHNGRQIAAVLQSLSEVGDGTALYHCQQGKDRTGIISALLLMLAGVGDEDIVANYEISFSYIKSSVLPIMDRYPDHMKQILRSDYPNMEKMLNHFYQHHHSAQDYLQNAGCSPATLEILRSKLI